MKRDYANRLSSLKRKRDPQLELPMGGKLEVIEQVGKLLLEDGYHRPAQLVAKKVRLPQRLIDLANRCHTKETNESDNGLLKQLRTAKDHLSIKGRDGTFLELLRAIAKAIGMVLKVKKKKETLANGTRKELVLSVKLVRLLPEVSDAWLVWSDRLGAQVRVDSWNSAHASVQLDALEMAFDKDPDYGDLFTAPYRGADSQDRRWEKINAKELDTALARLRHVRNTLDGGAMTPKIEHDLRELNVLEAIDRGAEPAEDGIRHLYVVYDKRSGLGRRTASSPSMQACPSSLRPMLLKLYYHDIDIVNCHPSLMIQVVTKMGKLSEIPTLVLYVGSRDAMLQRIADHFGVDKAACKFAVLRVLNGGAVEKWCEDIGLPAGTDTNQPDLRDLAEEAQVIRSAFFEMTEQMHPEAVAKLTEIVRARPDKQGASKAAIKRAVFSHCMFELEDAVLSVIDTHFLTNGWTVASLIYDGMHVEHRRDDSQDAEARWILLEAAMREAEAAVYRKLGYKVQLKEKPLFEEELEEEPYEAPDDD